MKIHQKKNFCLDEKKTLYIKTDRENIIVVYE